MAAKTIFVTLCNRPNAKINADYLKTADFIFFHQKPAYIGYLDDYKKEGGIFYPF